MPALRMAGTESEEMVRRRPAARQHSAMPSPSRALNTPRPSQLGGAPLAAMPSRHMGASTRSKAKKPGEAWIHLHQEATRVHAAEAALLAAEAVPLQATAALSGCTACIAACLHALLAAPLVPLLGSLLILAISVFALARKGQPGQGDRGHGNEGAEPNGSGLRQLRHAAAPVLPAGSGRGEAQARVGGAKGRAGGCFVMIDVLLLLLLRSALNIVGCTPGAEARHSGQGSPVQQPAGGTAQWCRQRQAGSATPLPHAPVATAVPTAHRSM